MRVRVIAEAGVNHNGSLERAKEMIDAAAEAGANIVKFQSFHASQVVSKYSPKAAYQQAVTDSCESQFEMLKRLELGRLEHAVLIEHARRRNIEFLSTPFDMESVDVLTGLGLCTLKIPSGEVTNFPLLLKVASTGCSIIFSTGMSTLEEVEQALGVLAYGFLKSEEPPSAQAFSESYKDPCAVGLLKSRVILLHCTTEYPASLDNTNLLSISLMREKFGLSVGYSDHTQGNLASIVAVALGAEVIEKHFTLDKTLPGPDHQASLEPHELKELIESIRNVETALGENIKAPCATEVSNKNTIRRSLVAGCKISKGDIFSSGNIAVKRPGTGISPMKYWELIGRQASRDYEEDQLIDENL